MIRRTSAVIIFALLAAAGCTSTPLRLGKIEPVSGATQGRSIQGEACGFQLMAFIPIGILDRNERAYQQMVEQAKGEIIADVQMQERWSFAVVGWRSCTTITGKAYPRGRG